MRKLAQYDINKLIDYLDERLTFERASVELYDVIIHKMKRVADPQLSMILPEMQRYRDEEREHKEWLEDQIKELGGDITQKTERARLIERESKGIEEVVKGDAQTSHLFHALLTAELVDTSGWQLLLELADEAEDEEARSAFRYRLHQEENHLIFIRRVLTIIARTQVLGKQHSMAAAL